MDIINWDALIALLLAPFIWLLDGVILVLGLTLYYIVDGFFTVCTTIIATLDISSSVFNFAASLSSLPTQLTWLLDAVGFPQCVTVLAAAYLVRFLLNLIPAALTRV